MIHGWRASIGLGFAVALGAASAQVPTPAPPQARTATPAQPTASATVASKGETRTQLPDGRFLVLGGPTATSAARLYDPRTDQVMPLASGLAHARTAQTATLMPDGRVLILGGRNEAGVIPPPEIFDPGTRQFEAAPDPGLLPRIGHATTLLSDGQLLVFGGVDARGLAVTTAEIWNPRTRAVVVADRGAALERIDPSAQLRADGTVLVTGGTLADGKPAAGALLFQSERSQFVALTPAEANALLLAPTPSTLEIAASVPPADDRDFAPDGLVVLRFSQPVTVTSIDAASVTLLGPVGAVKGQVVPSQDGMLAFFTPEKPLFPGTQYTVLVQRAATVSGQVLDLGAFNFATRVLGQDAGAGAPAQVSAQPGAPADARATAGTAPAASTTPAAVPLPAQRLEAAALDAGDDESFVPTVVNHGGRWRTARPLPKDIQKRLHELLAAKGSLAYEDAFKERRLQGLRRVALKTGAVGATGVGGQVLRLNDRPLGNVVVSVGGVAARTNADGSFRLTGLAPGRHELFVDGSGAGGAGNEYAKFVIGVDVIDGQITEVPPVYLPRIRQQDWIPITSPTQRDLVIAHPNVPGMEIHIPRGAVLRERDGRIVTKIALVPLPLDRVPFAFPENAPVYVSVQPGGMVVQGLSAKTRGIRVLYPNLTAEKPGTLAKFWRYDPLVKGWYVYGNGRASADAKQIVPDPGVEVYDAIGFMYTLGNGPTPPVGAPPLRDGSCRGDPVSCASGLFLHTSTDIGIEDLLPLSVARTYRPADTVVRDFGYGTNHSYGIYLYLPGGSGNWQSAQLILPDGSRVDYPRITLGTDYASAIFEHTSSGSPFYKSRIAWMGTPNRWVLTLRDGGTLEFSDVGGVGLIKTTDRFGNGVEITRNSGRIARITSPSGRYLDFTYDAANRITEIEDLTGRSVTYEYYAAGDNSPGAAPGYLKRATWVVGGTDPNLTEEYTYTASGQMLTVKDRRGNTMVTNEYDANGRVFRQTLADSGVFQFAYTIDGNGKVTRADVTNPRNFVERLDFNAAGLITSKTLAYGTALAQTTTYEYQAGTNRLLATVDHRGRRTEQTYDANGNVASVTRLAGTADAVTDAFEYTPDFSLLKKYTDPRSKITTLTYDGGGRLLEVADPLGNKVTYTSNAAGQVTSATAGTGGNTIVTSYTYDAFDLRSVTTAGFTTTYTTDALGRVIALTDGRGNVTYTEYDQLSRLRKTTDPHGKVTELKYDGNGNLTEVKDPGLTTTTYMYDLRNRLATRTDPFAKADTWSWDGNGNLSYSIDRRNQRTDFTYDALDRRTLATYADASSTSYGYSFAGVEAEVTATEGAAVITRRLDGLDRLMYEITPQGRVDYAFDTASRRTSMQVPGQAAITYGWDDANRLTDTTRSGSTITLAYDEADRRKTVGFPNGVEQRMSYAQAWGRPTGIDYYLSGSPVQGQTDSQFDADGRPRTRTGTGGLPTTGLPNATTLTYDRNRLTQLNGVAWSYDFQGNLTGDGAYTYLWDARNRLTQIRQGGTPVASFSYDAFNRRTTRTVSGSATEYLHDGLTPIQEKVGANATQLVTGPGIDDYLARIEPTKTRYYLTDFLGSTVALANESGSLVTSYTYEPYGETTVTGEPSGNPFQFTGRENDGTGLYYYRARYYHPVAKRFVQEDPIGLAGGINPYAYVNGNPLRSTDPLGLEPVGRLPADPSQPAIFFNNARRRPPGCECPSSLQLTPADAIGGSMLAGAGAGAAVGLGVGIGMTGAEVGGAVGFVGTAGAFAVAGKTTMTGLVLGSAGGAVFGLAVAGVILLSDAPSATSCPAQCPPCR